MGRIRGRVRNDHRRAGSELPVVRAAHVGGEDFEWDESAAGVDNENLMINADDEDMFPTTYRSLTLNLYR